MPVEVYWDSREQGRLVLELSSPLDWEQFTAGVRRAHAVSAGDARDTSLIVWAGAAFPEGFALWRFSAIFREQPGTIRRTIIVVEKPSPVLGLAWQLAGIVRQLYPTKSAIYFTSSMREARALSTPADAGVV